MKEIEIGVHGCDDSTIIKMEVSEQELEFLNRLMKLVNTASTYGCMPCLEVNGVYYEDDEKEEQ